MTHNPEIDAAAYLAGSLDADERERFEEHLLSCEECWSEIDAGRRGIQNAEQAREFAPRHLRDHMRHVLAEETRPKVRRVPTARWLVAAVAVVMVAAAGVGVWSPWSQPDQPVAITAAVAGYVDSRLPGSATPDAPAPDLSALRLTEVGAGAGRLGALPVKAYAFRDASGRRLMVYMGTKEFPMAMGARPLNGSDGPWVARHEGVSVLCARYPHELLIVGKDNALVHAAAEALDVM